MMNKHLAKLQKELDILMHTKEKELLEKRYQKFRKMGVMS